MLKTKKSWLLAGGLIAIAVIGLLVAVVKASNTLDGCGDINGRDQDPFYRVNSASSTLDGGVLSASSCLITIVNRSNKDYFTPNKTQPEFELFKTNAPKYVSVSVCGDNVCGEGESINNCYRDCNIFSTESYCGDGICAQKIVCTTTQTTVTIPKPELCNSGLGQFVANVAYSALNGFWFYFTGTQMTNFCASAAPQFIPDEKCYEADEYYVNCPDDCYPTALSGCGVCGYSGNGSICPNYCHNGALDMVNCVYSGSTYISPYLVLNSHNLASKSKSLQNYFRVASALAIDYIGADPYLGTYKLDMGWSCNASVVDLCPEGKYCTPSGLLTDSQSNCPSGNFCPAGSYYPRICPPGTYSGPLSEACSLCPAGSYSTPGAGTWEECYPILKYGDGACQSSSMGAAYSENPVNSPDCPDERSVPSAPDYVPGQSAWYGDGRCTGVETMSTSSMYYSLDCKCGNGVCDNNESYAACYTDCHCGNGICDSSNQGNIPSYAVGIDETSVSCNQDCQCGDGFCDTSETTVSCPSDCKCGNGVCDINENRTSCSADCKCGNGACDTALGETAASCLADCKCGNGICDLALGETVASCSDCADDDGICDTQELSAPYGTIYYSPMDCHCGIDIPDNGTVGDPDCDSQYPYDENSTNCGDCTGSSPHIPDIPEYY